MISFHTKINGQDFEIEVADGLVLEMTDNKLTVKRSPVSSEKLAQPEVHYHYHYPQGQPYWNQLPVTVNPIPFVGPNITYGTVSTGTVSSDSEHNHNLCSQLQQSLIKN
jgi:hypothetical protein